MRKPSVVFIAVAILTHCLSCDRGENPAPSLPLNGITSDAELFAFVIQTQPFSSYTLFPGVDSVVSGTLNGSTAHQPLVRVSMNAVAFSALRNDTLPVGATFPDGSVIFKQILDSGQTTLYAIMYKDLSNPFASEGRLWAELRPNGDVFYSITNRGAGCTGCHMLERGSQNDLVRTFERRRP